MTYTERRLGPLVREALEFSRVVVVAGPRQAGKTTLVRSLTEGQGTFHRLDDDVTLQAAVADPRGFVSFGDRPIVIDEIQRGGDPLVRAIKLAVDEDPTPGQFLLNGSADFLTVPTISESLAGRAVLLDLWPFSQGEIHGTDDSFVQLAFSDATAIRATRPCDLTTRGYLDRLCAGGYPDAVALPSGARGRWFSNYLRTLIQRDVTELTGARKADQLPRLLRALAARTSSELVMASVHRDVGLGALDTTADYVSYLEMIYLIHRIPAWSRNLTAKVKKHPKVYLTDTGLAAALLGKTSAALANPLDPARGPLLETLVVNEIAKQLSWAEDEMRPYHFRDRSGIEIDLILEHGDGRIVAIEVKSAATVSQQDVRHLVWLRDKLGDQFIHGFILYTGTHTHSFGDRITATPVASLWDPS